MRKSECDLAQIVARASSLSEHLRSSLKTETVPACEQEVIINERLSRWCQVVAQGDWEKFQKRLQRDGLDMETVRPMLGAVRLADSHILPNWAETLLAVIQMSSAFTQIQNQKAKIPQDLEKPLPFEDVLLPAVLVARQKLLKNLGCDSLSLDELPLELLCESAYLKLERSLLQRLTSICAKTLESEFSHSRPLGQSLLCQLIGMSGTQGIHYSAFVQKLLQDGLLTFFHKYPVLGRLVATAIDFWVEANLEFLQRLKADLSAIGQVFARSEQNNGVKGKVTEIKPALSDPHKRGRCVIALTFESGLKLVYKPKDLGLEVAYNQFLDWCNQQGVPLPLKVIKVLNNGTYGWVEYVEQQPCDSQAAVQRFYERAGMLLCLLYALRGTDCHYENLIASGEHLVLVDMETLFHHEANPMVTDTTNEAENTLQPFWNSVLQTGLLPRWQFSNDNIAYDVSGLSDGATETALKLRQWKSINTDDMHLGFETHTPSARANVPILNGAVVSPNNYVENLVSGFEQMYRFLLEQQQALLATDGPLRVFQAQWVRFVFRATQVYGVVLQNSLAPEFLRHGVERSIELDILTRAFLNQEQPETWSICRAELEAMEQLDIPYFGANSHSDTLSVGVEPLQNYFVEPSYSQVLTRLQNLNQIDLAQQVAIIRGAFYARVARTPGSVETEASESLSSRYATLTTPKQADFSQIAPLTSEQLVQKASNIAAEIQQQALRGADGSVNWIGLDFVPGAERFQLQPLGASLYNGKCGIALFLAALGG